MLDYSFRSNKSNIDALLDRCPKNMDPYSALKYAARNNKSGLLLRLLDRFRNKIDAVKLLELCNFSDIKQHHNIVKIIEDIISKSPKLLPYTLESLDFYLSQHDGQLANLEQTKIDFIIQPCTKLKYDPTREHSVIKTNNGSLYAIFRGGFLGKGVGGKIKIAQNLNTLEICVVKILKDQQSSEKEIQILKMMGLFLEQQISSDSRKQYIFTKYIPGCTLKRLYELENFKIPLAIFEQLKLAQSILVSYIPLIQNHILHDDFHPENIMITTQLKAVVIDFGESKIIDPETTSACVREAFGVLQRALVNTPIEKNGRIAALRIKLGQLYNSNSSSELLLEIFNALISEFDAQIEKQAHHKMVPTQLDEFLAYDRALINSLYQYTAHNNAGHKRKRVEKEPQNISEKHLKLG